MTFTEMLFILFICFVIFEVIVAACLETDREKAEEEKRHILHILYGREVKRYDSDKEKRL